MSLFFFPFVLFVFFYDITSFVLLGSDSTKWCKREVAKRCKQTQRGAYNCIITCILCIRSNCIHEHFFKGFTIIVVYKMLIFIVCLVIVKNISWLWFITYCKSSSSNSVYLLRRVFIRHSRSENSSFTMPNSLANIQ